DDPSSSTLKQELLHRCPDIRKMKSVAGSEGSFTMLAHTRQWQSLEILELSGLRVEPDILLYVLASFPILHEIVLGDIPCLEDSIFMPSNTLPPFPQLTILALQNCPAVTADGLVAYLSRAETRETLTELRLSQTGVQASTLHEILRVAPYLRNLTISETVSRSFPLTPVPPLASQSLRTLRYEILPATNLPNPPSETYYTYLATSILSRSLPSLTELYAFCPSLPDLLLYPPAAPFTTPSSPNNRSRFSAYSIDSSYTSPNHAQPPYAKSTTLSGLISPLDLYTKSASAPELEWSFTYIEPPNASNGRRGSVTATRPLSMVANDGQLSPRGWGTKGRDSTLVGNGFGGFLAVPNEDNGGGGPLSSHGHKRSGSKGNQWMDGVKDRPKACSPTPLVMYGVKEDAEWRWRLVYGHDGEMGCSGWPVIIFYQSIASRRIFLQADFDLVATYKMETEVQAPSYPKFSRYRTVRNALKRNEAKPALPLPQLTSTTEDPRQEKSRHRHISSRVEVPGETYSHHHQQQQVRATAIDARGTSQVYLPSREREDIEKGIRPSWSAELDHFSPNADKTVLYRQRTTSNDVNLSQGPSPHERTIDSHLPDSHHARDPHRRRRPRARQPEEHSRPLVTDKHDSSSHNSYGKASEDMRPALPRTTNFEGISKDMISLPIGIQQGGEGTVPGIDAPLSAVNAGERKVRVVYKNYSIPVPVSPSTKTVDIIRSAADVVADNDFNAGTIDVVEHFKQLGLERAIRPYEDIRDVLNSWGQDDQNTLILQPTGKGDNEDIDLNKIPVRQPIETSAWMYYSNKPDSWDKRIITLRSDGQIVIAKQEHKDTKNLCHMRDFDIYVPTRRQIKESLRPPKKICFAIKSQHKSSMFVSTENFVHFFATRDKIVAASWFKAVQSWRSWHLVHVMGKLQKKSLTPATSREAMVDARTLKAQNRAACKNSGLPRPPSPPPPPSYSNHHAKDTYPGAVSAGNVIRDPTLVQHNASRSVEQDQGPFMATGLLGRAYTQRRRVQQQRGHTSVAEPRPALPAPVPNAYTSGRTMSMRHGNNEFSNSKRGSGQHQRHKPLVDLTPEFREPPQHVRKGRGVVPELMPAGGLIDIATSPEIAIPVPPATTWRRPVSQ
ncbi:MAG: hypothetical protein Q9187_005395, partial [Circinaria calcarea]